MSPQFKALRERIRVLTKRFLPPVRPLGDYSKPQQDQIRAYIVLCHAEFESFLESLAERLLEGLFNEITNSSPAKALVDFHARRLFEDGYKKINDNHGLKSQNIRSLLEPFGLHTVDLELIDPAFLQRMSAFGTLRGGLAHSSLSQQMSLKQSLDAKRVAREVNEIVNNLCELDRLIQKRIDVGLLYFRD